MGPSGGGLGRGSGEAHLVSDFGLKIRCQGQLGWTAKKKGNLGATCSKHEVNQGITEFLLMVKRRLKWQKSM